MKIFLEQCRELIGAEHVLTDSADMAPYLIDHRRRYSGSALAIVQPDSTEAVAGIVRLCRDARVPIVPQGGNTGLVLGSVPDQSGRAIVLSLTRLNRIRSIDLLNNTMTVDAGCILTHIQQAAADTGRLFPLSLAAEGSCTIGGNLSTNAGGTAVLRYGNARELCLGLEVVTADGDIWDGLRGLRKDNTGYDLRDLFIGAEGTLGVITAAVLKLYPQPQAQATALLAVPTPAAALQLLALMQARCGDALTGFELMSDYCLQLVCKHFPQLRSPFAQAYPHYVLLELRDNETDQQDQHVRALLEASCAAALEAGLMQDAVIAASHTQAQTLWQMREYISPAQAREGKNIKHDIAVPVSRVADFIAATDQLLQQHFPGCRMVIFGHLGDGNLHYNVSAPQDVPEADFLARQATVNRVVYDSVHHFGGSISAEHGIGALKRDEIRRYKSTVEIKLQQHIKQALDPLNLMNPGKLVQE